jgi:hypothetical protein
MNSDGRFIEWRCSESKPDMHLLYSPASRVVAYLSIEMSKGGLEIVLVITDHSTRCAQAIPTRNQTARTTARALFDNYFVHYGFPEKLSRQMKTATAQLVPGHNVKKECICIELKRQCNYPLFQ